jgi:pimeloyl-ACP methyl ester carboxylesterase
MRSDIPWLLIHGAGGGAWEWAVWLRVLAAAGVDARAIELAPTEPLESTRLADYAAQVRDVAAGLDRPVLVGASLGGLLAAMAADAVAARAVILVNPLPPAPWHAGLPARAAWPARVAWRSTASAAGTARAVPDAAPGTVEWAWRRWRDESGAVLDEAGAGVAVNRPRCPLLVIASGVDDDVPDAVSAALAAGWQADLVRVPGASHVGPLLGTSAAAVARQTLAWVDATVTHASASA